ncbi:hypothetical protein C8Q79DRAFT_1003114 [Trametes meyenii]|nr:hypothetical protein C8Q79DRAFT_1003114 [Trametes meyenii]
MLSRKTTGISLQVPPALYVSGRLVEGEVELDFRQLQQDNIKEVQVQLRGWADTSYTINSSVIVERVPLVRDDVSLWSRIGPVQPPPGEHTMRVPFRLELPPDLPPSFTYFGLKYAGTGSIRYSVTAIGVRPGSLQLNRRVRVPLALVPKDVEGVRVRERFSALTAATVSQWRTESRQEKIRRGLWGDYSILSIPDEPVFPLFSPIPIVIKVQTTTPPTARHKAEANSPGKPIFPPAPGSYDKLEFKLQRQASLSAQKVEERATFDVTMFSQDASAVVDADVPEKEWVPVDVPEKALGSRNAVDSKGSWVQRSTFRTTVRLDCPPSFTIETLKCAYRFVVRVPFPGVGNNVEVSIPICVTSGIDMPIIRDGAGVTASSSGATTETFLDLPPEYWNDDDDAVWDDMKKD